MENAAYSDDASKIVLPSWYKGKDADEIPVSLVDSIIESGFSLRDLEKALLFRRVTANGSPEWFNMRDLNHVDLTGKIVYIYYRNYEDSEWLSSKNVVGVQQVDSEYYSFVFSEDVDEDVYELLEGQNVFSLDRVLVITPHV